MSEVPSEVQIIQDAANLAMLARQAISNGFPTMEVDVKMIANLALRVEQHEQAQSQEVLPEGDSVPAMLEHAKEEGRCEMIAECAREKAELLQRILELEESCNNLNTRLVAAVGKQGELLPPLTLDVDGAPVTGDHPKQTLLFPEHSQSPANGGDEFKGPGQN